MYVIGTVAFVMDTDSLKNHLDIGINAWRWKVYKAHASPTADISKEASYSVSDRLDKCNDSHEFERQILAIYPAGYQCKSGKSPYGFYRGNILTSYNI